MLTPIRRYKLLLSQSVICSFIIFYLSLLMGWSIPVVQGGQVVVEEYDTLLITPIMQGVFVLPHTGVKLEIGYATVHAPAHLTVTQKQTSSGERYSFVATNAYGVPLDRFEMPLIASMRFNTEIYTAVIGWPVEIEESAISPNEFEAWPNQGRWLIVFDAHGIYAVSEDVVYLGPLEHYTPELIEHDLRWGTISFTAAPPFERSILKSITQNGTTRTIEIPSAARSARYRDRFIPEDLSNPGGFMVLGWTEHTALPALIRALWATIPNDPSLPAPGVPQAPIDLILPFDCTQDWMVSWGYHHSTPQNRFAIDFAALTPQGTHDQPVFAAHAGTVYLKRYGTPEHMIDVGFSARVVAPDSITSTVYGHLEPIATMDYWEIEANTLLDFEWTEVGEVYQGQLIGVAGSSGYATGAHIHFTVWSWDQSLYQPVPLGPLAEFTRGMQIQSTLRRNCKAYHSR